MKLRPKVIGGLDLFSHTIANRFMEMHKELYPLIDIVNIEDESGISTLKNHLVKMREQLRNRHDNRVPQVVMFASASNKDNKDTLKRLKDISRELKNSLPGDQEIILDVMFPPSLTEKGEKIATYHFFSQLEKVVFDTPYLKNIFIYPVSQDLYNGYHEGIPDHQNSAALFQFLKRQLTDADIGDAIQSTGGSAIANKTRTAGRSSCYTTCSAYTLNYHRDECIKYLDARLQKVLFEEDLLNLPSIEKTPEILKDIQTRSDRLIANQLVDYNGYIKPHLSDLPLIGNPVQDAEALEGQLEDIREQVEKMIDGLTWPRYKVKKDPDAVKQAFCSFLEESPGYLAGGTLYIQSLMGRQLVQDDDGEMIRLSGIDLFQQQFYRRPLYAAIESYCKPFVNQHCSVAIDRHYDHEKELPWIYQVIESLMVNTPVENFTAFFISQSLQILSEHLYTKRIKPADGRMLLSKIIGLVRSGKNQFDIETQARLNLLEETDQKFILFKKEIGFWGRWFSKRGIYKAEQARIRELNARVRQELKDLEHAFTSVKHYIFGLLQDVILPAIIRAHANQVFAEKVGETADRFSRFTDDIKEDIIGRWDSAVQFTRAVTPIFETILTEDILEELFKKEVDRTVCTARNILAWLPQGLSRQEMKKLTYFKCTNLKDHYLAGSGSLKDRLRQYTVEQVSPVIRMNILDILEIMGKKFAREYLKSRLARLDDFMELSPGLMPIVHQEKKALKMVVVRTAEPVIAAIKSSYDDLISFEPRWIDNSDDCSIDLTCLHFGLPAFVFHGLAECRELSKSEETFPDNDLWPLNT